MAESVIAHFAAVKASHVAEALDPATSVGRIDVSLPVGSEYLIRVYPYLDIDAEYEDEEKQRLVEALGCVPLSSMAFELRRSQQGAACRLLRKLLSNELSEFHFVIDDGMGEFWRQTEILRRPNEFLRGYEYNDAGND